MVLVFARTSRFTLTAQNKFRALYVRHATNSATKTLSKLAEYRKPIIYNALVIKELAKEVYIKEGLRPPTMSEISQVWSNLQSFGLKDLKEIGLRDAARIVIRSVEVFGFFAIGEMIGRRSLIGYKD
ncbi:mitochondrial ATP synthase g subunit-domain-containing protein [Gigaspora rosea]|uniref:Mitochondrial ATP synthase g subunit-domain-containing protein n=1 Tax=Gigaspora rosea TaxID=44941 RepID=A0A397UC36_9GLOM|nr:mitochondrial ATP synthase g subunit-domain-containing protein [Gigaspora rosea]